MAEKDDMERKRSEEEFKVSAARISDLSKYANDFMILLDEDYRFLEVNERVVEVYGYSREELRTMRAVQFRAPEAKANFAEDFKVAQTTGKALFETVHQRKDGTTFPVEINLRLVDVGGKKFYQAIIRDITERKAVEERMNALNQHLKASMQQLMASNQQLRANEQQLKAANQQLRASEQHIKVVNLQLESSNLQLRREMAERNQIAEALKNSEAMLRSVVSTVPIGIGIIYDKSIQWTNDYLLQLSGYARKDMMKQSARLFYDSDEQYAQTRDRFYSELREKGKAEIETQWSIKGGGTRSIFLTGAFLEGRDESRGVVFAALDVTERKKMEEELRKKIREFEIIFKSAVGREERIVELKNKIKELEQKLKEK